MKAMILAAGVGSRLDPLTRNVPKPMVPIVNKPVMEHTIELLKQHGFHNIMVNLHYFADQIEEHFGDGKKWGVKITYSKEDQLWGDAGSIKRVDKFFNDTFLVIGGDALTDLDLSRLIRFHKEKKAIATIALSLVDDPSEYGIALQNERGKITRFLEKPKGEVIFSNTANTGVYVFDPTVFDLIPRGVSYGLGKNLLPLLLEQKRPFYGFLTSAYWKDVGDLNIYRKTQTDAMEGKVDLKFPFKQHHKYVWIGENTDIRTKPENIGYPVVIGNNCVIEPGAKVLEGSVLGDNCVVEEGATVMSSLMWKGARVQHNTYIERCIIGKDCHVKSNAAIFNGVIVDPSRGQVEKGAI